MFWLLSIEILLLYFFVKKSVFAVCESMISIDLKKMYIRLWENANKTDILKNNIFTTRRLQDMVWILFHSLSYVVQVITIQMKVFFLISLSFLDIM